MTPKFNSVLLVTLLFLFVVNACSSDGNDPVEDAVISDDAIAPKISYVSAPTIVESKSTIEISVDDASQVNTKIYMDGDLLLESDAKNISFDIDPFEYSSGTKTVRIVSTDVAGNESIDEYDLELKKLLFKLPNPVSDYRLKDQFLSVHFSDGKLYKTIRIETDEDGAFYAEDDFERQNFTLTLFYLTDEPRANYHYFYSYADIQPGTVLLSSFEKYEFFNQGNLGANARSDIELVDIAWPFIAGYNGHMHPYREDTYVLNYSSDGEKMYFLFSLHQFPYSIKDYSYMVINDPKRTEYTAADLSKPEVFTTIEFPNLTGSQFKIEGYPTEEDYLKNRFHVTLSTGISTTNIDIPLFPDLFETYNLVFSYTPDTKTRFTSRKKGLDQPIPNNEFDVSKSGDRLTIGGDHDYSRVRFVYWFSEQGAYNAFEWTFHQRESDALELPMENFEIPEEVALITDQRQIKLKPSELSQSYTYEFDMYKFSESIQYEDLFFGNDFRQNEAGDASWLTFDLR